MFVLLRAGETDESLLWPVTNKPIPGSGVYSTGKHELPRLVLYLYDVHYKIQHTVEIIFYHPAWFTVITVLFMKTLYVYLYEYSHYYFILF